MKNHPQYIVIHHTGTEYDHVKNINNNHKQRGFKPFINANSEPIYFGYHVFIDQFGFETYARPTKIAGQHCSKYNTKSIGICIEGKDNALTPATLKPLLRITKFYMKLYGIEAKNVMGHGELDTRKPSCPGFDMNKFRGLL